MRKNAPLYFIFILVLALFCVLVNLSQPYSINVGSFHQKFDGVAFNAGPIHFKPQFPFRKGLDLEGGTSVTLRADMKGIAESERENALESVKAVIEKRINLFGVSEPVVQTSK